MSPLLEIRDLSVAFDEAEVLHRVSLSVAAGERLALVGESGSGKSVTALCILRLLDSARISGSVRWQGRELLALDKREMQAIRGDEIAMIFQEPMTALNPLLTIGRQIAEVLELKKGLSPQQAWPRVLTLLQDTGIEEPERRAHSYPHQLSGGQRQRAMMAMALASEPKLLLADEPTTALDASLRLQMLQLLARLQARTGMAVLLITHDLALVRHFAQNIAVMEKGRLVEQGECSRVFAAPMHRYTRQLLASKPDRSALVAPADKQSPSLVQATELRVHYPVALPGLRGWFRQGRFEALRGADFSIRPGMTLGVMGESGSGKTSLAQAVLGLIPHDGQLAFSGQQWQGRPAADRALRRRVQVVFQDPFGSLSPRRTIGETVAEGLQLHGPALSAEQIQARVLSCLAEVGLTPEAFPGLLSRYPHAFSGGQRQRIALARALIVEPQLLVLDEPTSALDVTVQQQILALLQDLQKHRSMAYLLITHDLEVLRAMAHEVLVLQNGQVVESGAAEQVLSEPTHPYTQGLLAAFAG
ncbi:MAG: ABC transporter ATP-binding protein [Limnohabitans sp.]